MSGALLAMVILAVAVGVAAVAFKSQRGRWAGLLGLALLLGGVGVAVIGGLVADTERDETDALSLGILLVLAGLALSLWGFIRGRRGRG